MKLNINTKDSIPKCAVLTVFYWIRANCFLKIFFVIQLSVILSDHIDCFTLR